MILTEQDIDEDALRSAIVATGYEVKAVAKEPYEKKGLFHRRAATLKSKTLTAAWGKKLPFMMT